MENQAFKQAADGYYNIEKKWIVDYIPEGPNVVLDLGCATGRLGRRLREAGKASELIGVELFEPAAREAAKFYDRVFANDIESFSLPYHDYFDYVICGDILEHLRDPWKTISRVYSSLKENGCLISSIPNIRYWRILRDLVFLGEWKYTEAGILDQTHLRFFTRKMFLSMLEEAKFTIVRHGLWVSGKKQGLANRVTFGILEEFLGSQIIAVAQKK